MTYSTSATTAGEIMDRSAVLLNDPGKTDYTYEVLTPLLKIAYDELVDSQMDSQIAPLNETTYNIFLPIGGNKIYPVESLNTPKFPHDLTEIQGMSERLAGSDNRFTPMKRVEFIDPFPPQDTLLVWAWTGESIRFNQNGAKTIREIKIDYLRGVPAEFGFGAVSIIASHNSRAFLAFKTAALAAMFIGENPERAAVLDAQAEKALERQESIANKGRQQIMTRHRPFRAAFKMRGGF